MQDQTDTPGITPVEAEGDPTTQDIKSLKRCLMWLPIRGYGLDGDLLGPDPESQTK
jgi:hypothetical protein